MREPFHILRRALVVALLGCLVLGSYACGQKGPLYLPEEPSEEEENEPKKKG